jgi:hypothetical protein
MSPTLCDEDRNDHYDNGELKMSEHIGRGDEPLAEFLAVNIVQTQVALIQKV